MKNLILLLYWQFVSLINIFCIYPVLFIFKYFLSTNLDYTIANSYFIATNFIIRWIYRTKIYIKNTDILNDLYLLDHKKILIQNHQSEFDDKMIFITFIYNNCLDINFRLIMAKKVYYIFPGIGLIIKSLGGTYISSDNKTNIKNLNNIKVKNNDWLLIYPEGTLSHLENLKKSNLYCKKNNIEPTYNVLYPKTTGVEIIDKNNNIKYIYTFCTHGDSLFPGTKPYRIYNTGIPKNVYIDLKKTEVTDIKQNIIDIFRDIDKSFDNRTYDDFQLYENYFKELYCFLLNMIFFVFNLILLYNYQIIRWFFMIEIIIYYIYIHFIW